MILLSITTTKNSGWREKIKEANKLGLKEIALFPTCLNTKQREELYFLLKKSTIKNIPFVHLRSDMNLEELDFFIKNYKTEVFNIHTQAQYPLIHDYSKYKSKIYIENVFQEFDKKELKNFAGICLDLSHLENDRLLNKKRFSKNIKIIEKYSLPIGCNHISAIKNLTHLDKSGELRYDEHHFENFSEFDYLKNYPPKYFSQFIAIEVTNSLSQQLKVRDYLFDSLFHKNFLNVQIDFSKFFVIPREETEFWIQKVIRELKIVNDKLQILDIFAGTGCLGIAVSKNIKNSFVDFVDNDKKAIEQIKINLKLNKISSKRYKIYKSDLFKKLEGKKYNVILANPPYVAKERLNEVQDTIKEFEPKIAWFGGKRGLVIISKFLKEAKNFLNKDGKIYFEFDPFQKEEVERIAKKENYQIQFFKDQFQKFRYAKLNFRDPISKI